MPVVATIAIAGGSAAWQGYQSHKANKQAAKQGEMLNENARIQQAAGRPLLAQGQRTMMGPGAGGALNPDFEQSAGYFRNILSGDRAAAAGALAPDIAAITDNYRGAERSAQANLRGGTRDLAMAELNRDRVGKTAGLRAALRPGAATALGDIGRFRTTTGLNQVNQGAGLLAGAVPPLSNVYSGLSNNAMQQGAYANQAGSAFGNILIDILKGQQKSPVATTPWSPPYSPYPTAPPRVTP